MKLKLSFIFLLFIFFFLSFSTIAQSSNVLLVEITGTIDQSTVELLKEARNVLDDWCEEYGHYELEVIRDKIDKYFDNQKIQESNRS